MQCYESKLMRYYLYKIVATHTPNVAYDDLVLSDLLHANGIESLQQLLNLTLEDLEKIAGLLTSDLKMAA